ncbi:MAG: hypothetical protein ABIU55_13815 [Ferruginibacter sp.]
MKLKASVGLVTFLLFAPAIFAQNQEAINRDNRERASREAAKAASDKQNAHNNRPFDSKAGSATGVLGRIGHYNSVSPDREAEIRAIKQRIKDNHIKSDNEAKAYGAAFAPYKKYYLSTLPLKEDEAQAMATRTVTSLAGPNRNEIALHEDAPFFLNVATSYTEFYKKAATAEFEELVGIALNFSILTAKSINALQGLIVRFPNKQQEIDMAIISAMQATYGSKIMTVTPCYGCQTFDEHRMVENMFFTMAKKYPDSLAAVVDAEYKSDPYKQNIGWARTKGKKGKNEVLRFQKEYMMLPMKTDREYWLKDLK